MRLFVPVGACVPILGHGEVWLQTASVWGSWRVLPAAGWHRWVLAWSGPQLTRTALGMSDLAAGNSPADEEEALGWCYFRRCCQICCWLCSSSASVAVAQTCPRAFARAKNKSEARGCPPGGGSCAPRHGGSLVVGAKHTLPRSPTHAPHHPGTKPLCIFFFPLCTLWLQWIWLPPHQLKSPVTWHSRGREPSCPFCRAFSPKGFWAQRREQSRRTTGACMLEQHPCPAGRAPSWTPTASRLPPGPGACKHCFFSFFFFPLFFFLYPFPPLGKQAQHTAHSSSPRSP